MSYVILGRLRQTIDEYFAGKTFGLDILKYSTRSLRRCGAAQMRPYREGCARYSSGMGDLGSPVRYHSKTTPASGPHGAATPRRSLLSPIFRVARFI